MGDDVLFEMDPRWRTLTATYTPPNMAPSVSPLESRETWTPYLSDQVLVTHPRIQCEGRFCAVHTPSAHGMREWMQWHEDGITYRVCPHGENHADPDEIRTQMLVRGCVGDCDGCCLPARYAPMVAEWGRELTRMTLDQFKARRTTNMLASGGITGTYRA